MILAQRGSYWQGGLGAADERLDDHRLGAGPGAEAGEVLDRHLDDVGRHGERLVVLQPAVLQPGLEELSPDRQRRLGAGHVAADGTVAVVADPHQRGVARRETDKPGVRVVVGGAGLAGQRQRQLGGRLGGAAVDHALEHAGQQVGDLRLHRLVGAGAVLLQDAAVAVADPLDEVGLDVQTLVGDGGVGGGHLERRQRRGAERQAGVGRQVRRDAAALGEVDDLSDPDQVLELDRGDVDRQLERPPQGGDAVVAR